MQILANLFIEIKAVIWASKVNKAFTGRSNNLRPILKLFYFYFYVAALLNLNLWSLTTLVKSKR